jgi:hypothetical protein
LVENHFLELKREIPPGKGNNQELAADLASLAVDGGTIIVGVAQRENDAPALVPQPLGGLRERIAEVARTIPDPPLPVTVDRLPSAGDDAIGYLVIHVPASPNAPHMVGGRYRGRGDATKLVLSDPEVRRLHALHRDDEADPDAMIRAEIDRDPIPEGLRVNVRGSVVKRGKTYAVVVELDRDPATGKRRQKWQSGYRTKHAAERALAEQVDAMRRCWPTAGRRRG